jgi:hypothetical protein
MISLKAFNITDQQAQIRLAIMQEQFVDMYRKSHFRIHVPDDMHRKSHFCIYITNDMYRESGFSIQTGVTV